MRHRDPVDHSLWTMGEPNKYEKIGCLLVAPIILIVWLIWKST